MSSQAKTTPLMLQYFEIKAQFNDTLVFFQVGDFFELFFDDAIAAAAFLNITLTKRGQHQGQPIPLCGVPTQALDAYLIKLVKGGFKVAICEQLEVATPGKVVKRGITRVLTPGTLVDANLLDDKSASYFCSFFPIMSDWGVLFGELLTTQLFATVVPAQAFKTLESELSRFFPDEILLPNNKLGKQLQPFFKTLGYNTNFQIVHEQDQVKSWLHDQFDDITQTKIAQSSALYGALSNAYGYLAKCQPKSLNQFNAIKFYEPENFLILDSATQGHLELVKNQEDGSRRHSLLALIDKSTTGMGARMLKKWLMRPLVDLKAIMARQAAIDKLLKHILLREKLANILVVIADLERVVGRVALERGLLLDYLQLKQALAILPNIKNILHELNNAEQVELVSLIEHSIVDFNDLYCLLNSALNDDISKDWLIKAGFSAELDQIRILVSDANFKFIELEQREQQATGINSLKVRFNSVQGYYIEITKANLDQVPSHYLRQQTLVGKERYMTHELQQLQVALAQARQNIDSLEQEIFGNIKQAVFAQINVLRKLAAALAHLDALLALANVAYEYSYVRPEFNHEQQIIIKQGRHPVVEQVLANSFIPNDTCLNTQESLWIITGPNMGGKSTYLRQVAVICILAQIGSFVPAQSANLQVLDRVFTRIGASDNLARGKSTFLVEMEETATICRQATKNSLVILDEVGRGTSTFDGLAIAQAVVEYIYTQIGARCLFATHYHELVTLKDQFSGIANYYAASKVTNDGVVLLHKILPGVAQGSFGVQAAKCADLPEWIIKRAQILLNELNDNSLSGLAKPVNLGYINNDLASMNDNFRLHSLEQKLAQKDALINEIYTLDLDSVSPRQVVDFLWKFKQKQL